MAELQANTKARDPRTVLFSTPCPFRLEIVDILSRNTINLNESQQAIALAKGSLENYFDKFVGTDSPFIKADHFDSSSNSAASSGDLPGLVPLIEPSTKPDRL